MSTDLTAGIVRILNANGHTAGTGFLVSPEGLVLTCAHVVRLARNQAGDQVHLVFYRSGIEATAVVEQCLDPDDGDVALLRVNGAIPAAVALPLGASEGTSGHPFRAFGFPEQDPEKGMFGYGTIGDSKPETNRLLIVQLTASTEITQGFSGGPIFDIRNRRVVGMVSDIAAVDRSGRGGQTSFMIPTETLRSVATQLSVSNVCPYLGLDAFSEEDADFFFGRDPDVEHLLQRVKNSPSFLAILGPSGCGKSSVVRAGLLPKLRDGALPSSEIWGIVVVRPANDPFAQLATAGISDPDNILPRALERWLASQKGKARLVLVIDQFEELFVSCAQPLRGQFTEQIISVLDSSLPITVILVMRDDFYSRLSEEIPELGSWLENGISNIRTTLDGDDVAAMIQRPAHAVGLEVEPLLIELIKDHVMATDRGASVAGRTGRTSILPLLEFALTLVWSKRKDSLLTASSYESFGGLSGALTQWADDAYRRLDRDDQAIAERLFKNLIHVGNEAEQTPDTRIRRSVQSLCPENNGRHNVRRVIWMLADARLLVTYRDGLTKQESVEIIHDSLMREWGRLQQWVADDKRFLLWRQYVEDRARAWRATDPDVVDSQDTGRLLRGRDLDEAEARLNQRKEDVDEESQRYVRASLALRDRERLGVEKEQSQKKREHRRNRIVSMSVALLVLILAFILLALGWRNFEQAKTEATLQLADFTSRAMQSTEVGESFLGMHELADGVIAASKYSSAQFYNRVRLNVQDQLFPRLEGILELQSSVLSVEFSPDGTKILTASYDGTVQLWDLRTSAPELLSGPIKGYVDRLPVSARFSKNGQNALARTGDQQITIYRIPVSSDNVRIDLPYEPQDAQFCGETVITEEGRLGKKMDVWSIEGGGFLHRFDIAESDDSGHLEAIACSPDGGTITSVSSDGTVRLYKLTGFALAHTLNVPEQLFSVSFDPRGTRLLASGTSGIHVWNLEDWTELPELRGQVDLVNRGIWSPDGNTILGLSQGDNPKLWNFPQNGSNPRISLITLAGQGGAPSHTGFPKSGTFTPDGRSIVTWQSDTVKIWDRNTGLITATLRGSKGGVFVGGVSSLDLSKAGDMLAEGSYDGTVRIYRFPSAPSVRAEWNKPWQNNECGVRDRGDTRKGVTLDSYATLFPGDDEVGENALRKILSGRGYCWHIISPDGRYNVRGESIYNSASGALVHKLPDLKELVDGAFNLSVDVFVATQIGDETLVYDVDSGKLLKRLPVQEYRVPLVFTPDGNKLMMVQDSSAFVWSTSTWSQINSIPADGQVLRFANFDESGKLVITGDGDGIGKLWSIAQPGEARLLATLPPANQDLISGAFDLSGRLFCTYSGDGKTHIWETEPQMASDRYIAVLRAGGVPTFLQRGESLMTLSEVERGKTVEAVGRRWDLSPIDGTAEQIKLWVEVRTGTIEDQSQTGGVRGLQLTEWRAKRDALIRSGFRYPKN